MIAAAPGDAGVAPEAVSYFRAVQRAWEETSSRVSVTEVHHFIAGRRVAIRFAGEALRHIIGPALAHRMVDAPGGNADLTVLVADSGGGIEPALPRWPEDVYWSRGEVKGFNDERICTAFHRASALTQLLDRKSGTAVYWSHDPKRLAMHDMAAPLLAIFHWWFRDQGVQLVHSAAVGDAEGAVLLAGQGGAGKSTTALAALAHGMRYLGDDYCLLSTGPSAAVHSLYCSAKLNAASRAMLPEPGPYEPVHDPFDTGKQLAFLSPAHHGQLAGSMPLRAVLVPRVTGRRETRVVRASGMEALRALAPSTVFQLAGADSRALKAMADVARRLPCWHLEAGTDLGGVAGAIQGLLAGGVATPPQAEGS